MAKKKMRWPKRLWVEYDEHDKVFFVHLAPEDAAEIGDTVEVAEYTLNRPRQVSTRAVVT
jgi:superfamily I DNA/RNA helicase